MRGSNTTSRKSDLFFTEVTVGTMDGWSLYARALAGRGGRAVRRGRVRWVTRVDGVGLSLAHLQIAVVGMVERDLVSPRGAWVRVGKAHLPGPRSLSPPTARDAAAPCDQTDANENEHQTADEDVRPATEDHLLVPI